MPAASLAFGRAISKGTEERRNKLLSGLPPEKRERLERELILLEEAAVSEMNMRPYELYDQLDSFKSQGLDLETLDRYTFNVSGFLKHAINEGLMKALDVSFYDQLKDGAVGGTREMQSMAKLWEGTKKGGLQGVRKFFDELSRIKEIRKPVLSAYMDLITSKDYPYKGFSPGELPNQDDVLEKVRSRYEKEGYADGIPVKDEEEWKKEVKNIIDEHITEEDLKLGAKLASEASEMIYKDDAGVINLGRNFAEGIVNAEVGATLQNARNFEERVERIQYLTDMGHVEKDSVLFSQEAIKQMVEKGRGEREALGFLVGAPMPGGKIYVEKYAHHSVGAPDRTMLSSEFIRKLGLKPEQIVGIFHTHPQLNGAADHSGKDKEGHMKFKNEIFRGKPLLSVVLAPNRREGGQIVALDYDKEGRKKRYNIEIETG